MVLLRTLVLISFSASIFGAAQLPAAAATSKPSSSAQEQPSTAGQSGSSSGTAASVPNQTGSTGSSSAAQAADAPSSPPSTIVNLAPSGGNNVQLGIQVNGAYAYPFTFTWNAPSTLNLTLSPSGAITGTSSQTSDQSVTVTVTDSGGKQIDTYPIRLHVGTATIVMIGAGAAAPAPVAKTSGAADKAAIVPNSIYENGDTVTGTTVAGATTPTPNANTKPAAAAPAPTSGGSTTGTAGAAQADAPANPGSSGSSSSTGTVKPANAASASGSSSGGAPGDTSTGSAGQASTDKSNAGQSGNGSCPNSGAVTTLDVKRNAEPDVFTTTDCNGAFSYQFNTPFKLNDTVTVSVSPSSGTPVRTLQAQKPPYLFGEELRAIVGYQQAGASSSDFTQNWFLDFYISRPLAFRHPDQEGTSHPWRWWGNVRIASFPQAGNQTLAETATALPVQIGALKLNQLAQGAEFLSGIEYAPFKTFPFRGLSENTRQSFSLGFIAGFGATGFFSSPSSNVPVFYVPASGSPASVVFQNSYGNITTARVGFISPDVERFPKQYLAGVRLTTHYFDPTGMPLTSAPAMLQLTAGQNQVISGGRWQGVVGRVEAFYPLPFGNRGHSVAGAFSSVYLFASAQMRIGAPKIAPALVLQPDTSTPAYDPSVTLVPTPTTRDVYRFGFGVDLVGFISQLTGGSPKTPASGATQKSGSSQATAPPANTTTAGQ